MQIFIYFSIEQCAACGMSVRKRVLHLRPKSSKREALVCVTSVNYLKHHPDVDVLSSSHHDFVQTPKDRPPEPEKYYTHEEIIRCTVKKNIIICHSSSMLKKSAVLSVDGYPNDVCYRMEDYALFLKMIAKGYRFARLPTCLVDYRTKMERIIKQYAGFKYIKAEIDIYRLKKSWDSIPQSETSFPFQFFIILCLFL